MGIGQITNAAGDMQLRYGGVADRARRRSAEAGIKGQARTSNIGH